MSRRGCKSTMVSPDLSLHRKVPTAFPSYSLCPDLDPHSRVIKARYGWSRVSRVIPCPLLPSSLFPNLPEGVHLSERGPFAETGTADLRTPPVRCLPAVFGPPGGSRSDRLRGGNRRRRGDPGTPPDSRNVWVPDSLLPFRSSVTTPKRRFLPCMNPINPLPVPWPR